MNPAPKLDLRAIPLSSDQDIGRFASVPLRDLVGLHPFVVTPANGDSLPLPDRGQVGEVLAVGPTDAVYYLANPAPVTLADPPVLGEGYPGQRIRLSPRAASVTLPASSTFRGGPVTVEPGADLELTWDPAGVWSAVGVVPDSAAPEGPAGGDLAGVYPNPTVTKLSGSTATQAELTVYVDPNGDPTSPGTNPATPTTFDVAMAVAAATANTNVVLAASSTPYTTGGPILLAADGPELTARQGGVQSGGVTISDAITVTGSGFRASGVRFGGNLTLGGNGGHYLAACSSGAITITRTSPVGSITLMGCSFAAASYTSTGAGSGSLVLDGRTGFGAITCGSAGHTIILGGGSSTGRVTLTAGVLLAAQATIVDPTLAVNASVGTSVSLSRTACVTAGGAPVPVTASGSYTLTDVVYAPSGSVLGTSVGTPVEFSTGVRRGLRSILPTATRQTTLTTSTPPGVSPFAGSQVYLTYGPISVDVSKRYRGFFDLFALVSANNTAYWFEIFVDSTPLSAIPGLNITPSQQPLGAAGSVANVGGGIVIQNFPTGTYTLTVRVARGAGPGSVSYLTGSFEVFEEIPHV